MKETAGIETGIAEKSNWEKAKLGLVWRNRKKISQIIKDSFYLPFFILIFFLVCMVRVASTLMVYTPESKEE